MDKYIYDEKNGLWYELQGDYYLPCRKLPKEESRHIGGKSFVVLTGEVAAVREAIECGIHTENAEGMEVSHVVIPNPRKEIFDSLL